VGAGLRRPGGCDRTRGRPAPGQRPGPRDHRSRGDERFLSSSANAQPTGLAAAYFQYYAPLAKEVAGKYDSQATSGAYYFDAMLLLDQGMATAKSTDPQAVEAALDSGTPLVASRGTYTYTAKNREGPVESDFGLYLLTAAGCPTGICQTAPST
jgi:hypothetical protein